MRNYYDESDVRRMLEHLATPIMAAFPPDRSLNIVGIRTRGEVIARRLYDELCRRGYTKTALGVLDITMYRDDLSDIGPRPLVRPTKLELPIDGNPLVLVDDVLFTGRSVRAALNALNDFGRPAMIRLAVLVDRGGRELPVQPDYVGLTLTDVGRDHLVKVRLKETDGLEQIVVEPRRE